MKIVGVGLNKTGTKTLAACLGYWGCRHRTFDLEAFKQYRRKDYDSLMRTLETFDSFEDWPWPLIYQEIDQNFPNSKFILTKRKSPEIWFESLCKMAVRLGPLKDFEKYIYGYEMPQGHKDELIEIYNAHNKAVEAYFEDTPDKLW